MSTICDRAVRVITAAVLGETGDDGLPLAYYCGSAGCTHDACAIVRALMADDAEVTLRYGTEPDPQPPAAAHTVRPGDRVVVGIPHDGMTTVRAQRIRDELGEYLPGVDVVVVAAAQLLVYRGEGL